MQTTIELSEPERKLVIAALAKHCPPDDPVAAGLLARIDHNPETLAAVAKMEALCGRRAARPRSGRVSQRSPGIGPGPRSRAARHCANICDRRGNMNDRDRTKNLPADTGPPSDSAPEHGAGGDAEPVQSGPGDPLAPSGAERTT